MASVLTASISTMLLDRRCMLGHHPKPLVDTSHAFPRLRSSGIAYRVRPIANTGISSASWLGETDFSRGDDYGGWNYPRRSSDGLPEGGVLSWMLVGLRMALALCLAVFVFATFSTKAFNSRLIGSLAEFHHLLKLPAFNIPHGNSRDSIQNGNGSDGTSSKQKAIKVDDSDEKLEADDSSIRHEVGRVPDVWKVVVPPVVDSSHFEALSSLAKLKIVQSYQDPGELCTRRDYAQWLFLANHILARDSSNKVAPSVFIEGVTQLAFDDITPEDPDFPYIQGLAEAGIIPSKLACRHEHYSSCTTVDKKQSYCFFNPDMPLSRMDMVLWKVSIEHKCLPTVDKGTLAKKTGFLDVDQIQVDAWPAIFMDSLDSGQSVTFKAFGYSRLFQPNKPVTKGQAAIALVNGCAAPVVVDELSRVEAENSTRQAIIQDILSEMTLKGEIRSRWEKDLSHAKYQQIEAEKKLEFALSELENARTERQKKLPFIVKENAKLEYERKFLTSLKREINELKEKMSQEETEILLEKHRMEKCLKETQLKVENLVHAKYNAEAKREALRLYRLGLEDMAKQAQAQSSIITDAVKRWNGSDSLAVSSQIDIQEHRLA
eukprot:TRINITY_DN24818_c0_g1_i1.p1 TRINITY_DN24818_c0_g1~~TRINITY_DN24818_c0_g1_i1.p1  ORF type:complete len:603 (-),score=124.65 TRINITY_DN24818_c0_g1_i1:233-2041(-)